MGIEQLRRGIPRRFAILSGTWLAYIAAYGPLHPFFGIHTGITAFLPVVVTAWCGGSLAGAAAGLVTVPLTVALSSIFVGPTTGLWLSQPALIGTGAMVLVGAAVGRMRDLNVRTLEQIAERQRAETALRESELRFRTLTESSGAGIALMQEQGAIYVNPALERMSGYSRGELVSSLRPLQRLATLPDRSYRSRLLL